MRYIAILFLIFALGYGALYLVESRRSSPPVQQSYTPQNPDSVIEYISRTISDLSPEPATQGGTFFVTNITLDSGVGTVEYEDGHMLYRAQFSYEYTESGEVRVTQFELLEDDADVI